MKNKSQPKVVRRMALPVKNLPGRHPKTRRAAANKGGRPHVKYEVQPIAGAPSTIKEAKDGVARLIAQSQAAGIRPRDMAELYRAYSQLAAMEAKISAEDIEGIIIVDLDDAGVEKLRAWLAA